MNSNSKYLMAVFSLMLGISLGVPYLVSETEERNTSWLMLAIFFLVLALGFWLWIQREQRSAEEAAEEALDAAEDTFKELESKASTATKSDINGSSASAESVPVADASTSSDDAADTASESEPAEEALSSASTVAEIEEVAEDAKAGDPVAEAEVAEASAAPETATDDSEIEMDNDSTDDKPITQDELFKEEVNEIRDDKDAEANELADNAVTDSGEIDLTIIEGIGPKYAEILNNAGVTTFAQIAEMNTDEIVALVKANGGRKSGSMPTWVEQAKLAAAGDWDALATLQDELNGGRR